MYAHPRAFPIVLSALAALAFLLPGCVSISVTDTLPEDVKESFTKVDLDEGVAFSFTPNPDGEHISVDVGAASFTFNRLFDGMLTEFAQTKFERLNQESENRVEVQLNYLNGQERAYMGSRHLYELDVAIIVQVQRGDKVARREFTTFRRADMDGYGIQTSQIYDMLVDLISAVDAYSDQQLARLDSEA